MARSASDNSGHESQRGGSGGGAGSPGGAGTIRLAVHNSRTQIDAAEQAILGLLSQHQFPDAAQFAVRLALEEAIVNGFRHGHKHLPAETPIYLEYRVTPDEIELAIEDQGPGFNPVEVADPTLDENLEIPTGRGLLLMRAYMARVEYVGRGNRVEMVYRKPAKAE